MDWRYDEDLYGWELVIPGDRLYLLSEDGMNDYPLGTKVRFMDSSATVSDGKPVKVEGTVNGPVIRYDDGTPWAVPVWCQRDNGREPTTILVDPANLLAR